MHLNYPGPASCFLHPLSPQGAPLGSAARAAGLLAAASCLLRMAATGHFSCTSVYPWYSQWSRCRGDRRGISLEFHFCSPPRGRLPCPWSNSEQPTSFANRLSRMHTSATHHLPRKQAPSCPRQLPNGRGLSIDAGIWMSLSESVSGGRDLLQDGCLISSIS